MRTPVAIGVVGLGEAGAEVARAFDELPGAQLRWICDESREALRRASHRHPIATPTPDLETLLADETLDAIAIATPSSTHAEVVDRCLDADKHVLVQQPLAVSGRSARELLAHATRRDRRLMVSTPFLFQPAVRKLKELIDLGRLGDIYYVEVRSQAPPAPREDSVLWGLGVTALHALLDLVGDEPVETELRADAYTRPAVLEVATCWCRFATGITASLQLSWLDAREVSEVSVVGSKRTAVFDARSLDRKLTIYEKTPPRRAGAEELPRGEIVTPRLGHVDPVRAECETFLARIRSGADVAASHAAAAAVALVEDLESRAAPVLEASEPPVARPRLALVQPS